MRGVRALLVCVTVLALPGCFKHHELDESAVQPLDRQPEPPADGESDRDGSSDQAPDGDDEDGDDPEPSSPCASISDPVANLFCNLLGGGEGLGDLLGGLPNQGECDSMPPNNPLGQLLCGSSGQEPPGFEPPSEEDCENPGDPITQFLCDLRGGSDGNGDGEPASDPGERFRAFLESLLPSAEECAEPADGFVSFICRIFGAGLGEFADGQGDEDTAGE